MARLRPAVFTTNTAVVIRAVAVEHIRGLVTRLSLVPRTPQVVESSLERSPVDAALVTTWLLSLNPRRGTASDPVLAQQVTKFMTAPTTQPEVLQGVAEELFEEALRASSASRYGAPTVEDTSKMQTHLNNLMTLLKAARQDGPTRSRANACVRPGHVVGSTATGAGLSAASVPEGTDAHSDRARCSPTCSRRHPSCSLTSMSAALPRG